MDIVPLKRAWKSPAKGKAKKRRTEAKLEREKKAGIISGAQYADLKKWYRRYITPITTPEKLTRRLVYTDTLGLDASVGGSAHHVFSANGCFDPDVSSGGTHQPLGFDQYMLLYDHYRTIGSKITVTAWPSQTAGDYLVFGIRLDDNATSMSTAWRAEMLEQDRVKWNNVGNGAVQPRKCTNQFLAARDLNVSPSDDTLMGTDAANPSEQQYYDVFCFSPNSSVDLPVVYMTVRIEYLVEFSERKELAQS